MGDAPTLADLFGASTRSALHLEMRDGYALDDPMFTAWKAGYRADPTDRESWWRPWLSMIRDVTTKGMSVRRARIISEPVSEYIQFEYDITFTNVAAGEDVRWLPRRQATGLALPGNDFWLFDGRILTVNHFDGDGQATGMEHVTDPKTIELCATAFESVWQRATPHRAYSPT